MEDRSSRPHHTPSRLGVRTERRVIALRVNRRWESHRIASHLRLARSTVGRVLQPYRVPRLADVDQATGLPVPGPAPAHDEMTSPLGPVHVDSKRLGRVPDQGGCRAHRRGSRAALGAGRGRTRARREGRAAGGYRLPAPRLGRLPARGLLRDPGR